MARHPDPTPATIKELYGTAMHCAYPSCGEPLYRQVPELGKAALNSTIAHICAASPDGPRFDQAMSAEENRAGANLLVLCRFHSALIDDKEADFSVEQLQEWKVQQLNQGGGITITDEQINEILRASVTNEIMLQAEVINVGGQAGGGGGAIGAGAIGGPGGDSIVLNLDGEFPGGGGGAVVAPGRTPPDAGRAEEGRGHSEGTDGGDTSVSDSEGNVILFAQGGSAGGSPYEKRTTTRALAISTMLMCSSVHIRDGLVFMLEGAWQSVSVLNTPTTADLVVVLVIEADGTDVGHYSLHLAALGPDGRQCGYVRFPVVVEEAGDVVRIVRWVPLKIQIDGYGLYTLTVETDIEQLATIDLAVKRVTDDG